jgi:L-asparagine transporter-like permease
LYHHHRTKTFPSAIEKLSQAVTANILANVGSRALGGAIGTGLFIGSGAILSLVGPAPLFMGYISNMGKFF